MLRQQGLLDVLLTTHAARDRKIETLFLVLLMEQADAFEHYKMFAIILDRTDFQ